MKRRTTIIFDVLKVFILCTQISLIGILMGCSESRVDYGPLPTPQSCMVNYEVKIESEPAGAKVYVDDAYQSTTPFTLEIKGPVYKGCWGEDDIWGSSHAGNKYGPKKYYPHVPNWNRNHPVNQWYPDLVYVPGEDFHKYSRNITVFKEGYKLAKARISIDTVGVERYWGPPTLNLTSNKLFILEREQEEKPFRLPVEVYPPSQN